MALFGQDPDHLMEEGRLGERVFLYAVDRFNLANRRNQELRNRFVVRFNQGLRNGISMRQAILGAFLGVGFASEYAIKVASSVYQEFARQFESPDNVESFPNLPNQDTMARRTLRYDEDEPMEEATNKRERSESMVSNRSESGGGGPVDPTARMMAIGPPRGGDIQPSTTRQTGPGGVGRGTTETAITPAQPQYGLRDTHTVALPWTTYFTMITEKEKEEPQQHFSFRLNSLFDIFKSSFGAAPTAGGNLEPGLYQTMANTTAYSASTKWPNPLIPFYSTTSTSTAERPAWLLYFERMYRYYTVLGVEWKITFVNHQRNLNADLLIGYGTESTSVNNTGDVFPKDALIQHMQHWPQLKWKILPGHADGTKSMTSIGGYHRTGDAKRLVANDADVNTWTPMAQVPTYDESMVVWVGKGPFNDLLLTIPGVCGIKLELRYVAQMKDLKNVYMYPASQTTITQFAPADLQQF